MELKSKKNKILMSAFILAVGFTTTSLEASIIRVANATESAVFTRVVPGASDVNSTYCWSCFSNCLGSQCQTKNLYIPAEGTGTDNFTIVGTEGGILFNGTCANLSTHKNYDVLFFETPLGIGCQSTEI